MNEQFSSRYEVGSIIARNASTSFYRGSRSDDGAKVILKLANGDFPSAEAMAMLSHEYRILLRLKQESTLRCIDFESGSLGVALVLEDFGGQPIGNFIVPMPSERVLVLAVKMAAILGRIHEAGFAHLAIGPTAFWVNPNTQEIRLCGFGINRLNTSDPLLIEERTIPDLDLAYISPEQTGRIGRSTDYRSDFYSLGVLFFWMLTGKLPYEARDPLGWVHAHMAKEDPLANTIVPEVGAEISSVVHKLLAKTPESRYQSVSGLKSDLQECLARLTGTRSRGIFLPGKKDIPATLNIALGPFGREKELGQLLRSLDRVRNGTNEVCLLRGPPGIGKSSLVAEFRKRIQMETGMFASGAFDATYREVPYYAFRGLFRELFYQMFLGDSKQSAEWKEKIRNAVGPLGQALEPLIPDLNGVLGQHLKLPDVDPMETSNRFEMAFQNVMELLTRQAAPLVFFLDDVQWSDRGSLRLLEVLAACSSRGVMLVLAFRDEEELGSGNFKAIKESLQQRGFAAVEIQLGEVSSDSVHEMLLETLHGKTNEIADLAEVVHAKTGGNPFSIVEFIGCSL